jgi:hypothetical protein
MDPGGIEHRPTRIECVTTIGNVIAKRIGDLLTKLNLDESVKSGLMEGLASTASDFEARSYYKNPHSFAIATEARRTAIMSGTARALRQGISPSQPESKAIAIASLTNLVLLLDLHGDVFDHEIFEKKA